MQRPVTIDVPLAIRVSTDLCGAHKNVVAKVFLLNVPMYAQECVSAVTAAVGAAMGPPIELLASHVQAESRLLHVVGAESLEKEYGGDNGFYGDHSIAFYNDSMQSQNSRFADGSRLQWRPRGIIYRCNLICHDVIQKFVRATVSSSGHVTAATVHTQVAVNAKMSDNPHVTVFMKGADTLINGQMHECVDSVRGTGVEGGLSLSFIPPDGRTVLMSGQREFGGSAGGENQLANMRPPLSVRAVASEDARKTSCKIEITLTLPDGVDSASGIEIWIPLHPHHVPGNVHVDSDMGEATTLGDRVRWNVPAAWRGQERPATAASQLSGANSRPGTTTSQTSSSYRRRRGEPVEEWQASLKVTMPITQSLLYLHGPTKPRVMEEWPCDAELWVEKEKIGRAIGGLNERRHPFKEDRNEDDKLLRVALNQANAHCEMNLASRRLASKLHSVECTVKDMSGEWATGTEVTGVVIRAAPYPYSKDFTWQCSADSMQFMFGDLKQYSNKASIFHDDKPDKKIDDNNIKG